MRAEPPSGPNKRPAVLLLLLLLLLLVGLRRSLPDAPEATPSPEDLAPEGSTPTLERRKKRPAPVGDISASASSREPGTVDVVHFLCPVDSAVEGPGRLTLEGERGWFAHWRVGADSVDDNAFRVLNIVTAA